MPVTAGDPPLAWRDPATNTALAARLGQALRGSPTLFLDPDDASPASDDWQSVRAELEAGTNDSPTLTQVTPAIGARRWRRPRTERGLVLMLSGLSDSGRSNLARGTSDWISVHAERSVSLLDGDVVRTMLSSAWASPRPTAS